MDTEKVAKAVRMLLEAIGDDPDREGVARTPERVARMYAEIFMGYREDPASLMTVIAAEQYDEIVLVKDIPFYSMCEHHLLPFTGLAHVAYLPESGRMTGISKLARIVDVHARRLQVQERLTTQVAATIMDSLRPRGAMVVIEAEHLCMTMRGVKKPGAKTVTSVVRGIFRENPATRAEAMALIQAGRA